MLIVVSWNNMDCSLQMSSSEKETRQRIIWYSPYTWIKNNQRKSVVQESKQWEQVSGEAGTGGHGVMFPHLHSAYTGGSQKEMHWEIQWKIIASAHNAKFWCVVCFVCMSMVHKWGCGCVHTCAHLGRPKQNLRCLPLLLRSLAELEALARLAALGTHGGLSGLQCWNYRACTAMHSLKCLF